MIVFKTHTQYGRNSYRIRKTLKQKCEEGEKKTCYYDDNNIKKHNEVMMKKHNAFIKKLLKS